MKKNLLLIKIPAIVLISLQISWGQLITNSEPNRACRTSVSGTLTVSNYDKVEQWEQGELIGGTFHTVFTYNVRTPSFNYSLNTNIGYFRVKLTPTKYSSVVTIISDYPPSAGALSGNATYQETGSGTLTLSGYSGQIVKWQSSTNGGPWLDIAHTGSSYTYSNLTETTRFLAVVGRGVCPVVYSNLVTVIVKKKGMLTGPATVSEEAIAPITLENYDAEILQWEYSTDGGTTWTIDPCTAPTFNHPVSAPTQFRVLLDLTPFGLQYSPIHEVLLNTTSYSEANPVGGVAGQNYVREQTVAIAGITTPTQVDALTLAEKHESITYGNGFNTPVQRVTRQASPQQQDVVNFSVYDKYGRASKAYLPYVAPTSDGSYRNNFLADHAAFYANGATDKIEDSTYPFAETKFENSPLGRPIEQGSVGEGFQPGSGHTVRNSYKTNVTNEVRLFQPDGSSTGFYPANKLTKIEVTDADDRKREVFVDNTGKTILQRVQLDENINDTYVSWLETYYIYNTNGSLRFVISPKGVAALQEGGWLFTQAIQDQYVYQFTYDNIGRMVEKKVPGQAPLYYCYDRLNRVVLIQDANTRSQHKWFYIKYDRKGRPVMQGLYTNTVETSRTSMQDNVIDPLYATPAAVYYEERGTAQHGYTNQSFPVANTEVLTVNYYDSYDFDYNGAPDFEYTPQSLTNENTPASTPSGMPTGSKRIVLGTNVWLYNYVYYDTKNRVIQVRSNNHLSPIIDNLVTVVYDFEGKRTLQKNYHNAGDNKITTVINKYAYDHAGRLIQIKQNNNNASTDQIVAQYVFNELGQLVDKKLHYTGSDFLQSIDLRYSIQGWLTSINNAQLTNDGGRNDDANDYFGMEYLYNTTEAGLTTSSDAKYSGNISAIKWKGIGAAPGAADQRSYTFTYDKANRLQGALSSMNSGNDWTKENGVMDENMTYDHNGNLQTLQRAQRKHGLSGILPAYTSEIMDNLTYTYNPNGGDQLLKVTDAALSIGFNNGSSGADNDYTYDAHGSMLSDVNKGISAIAYNFLGKPDLINFSDGRKIAYTYDAAGMKLTVKTFAAGSSSPQHVMDYVSGFVYENDTLSFFASPEGRVVNKGSGLEYQYAIADHQGNTRVVFSSVNPTMAPIIATFEDATSDAQVFQNVNTSSIYWVSKPPANNTVSGQYVIRMNESYKTGPARSLKVFPGDVVDLEVWAYYEGTSGFGGSNQPLNVLIESVAGALTAGLPAGESTVISNGVSSAYGVFGAPGNLGDDRPTAYLNYILFDKDHNVLDMGWQPVPSSANMVKQKVSFASKAIKEAGYMYVYLSYEGEGTNWVYFDDLKITHTQTNVIQYNEYYPFGLQASTSWTRDGSKNNFLYNLASEINTTSGYYDLPFRNYDPATGRFIQVDPLADQDVFKSPYVYGGNNPVMFHDPSGLRADKPYERYSSGGDWRQRAVGGGVLRSSLNQKYDALFWDNVIESAKYGNESALGLLGAVTVYENGEFNGDQANKAGFETWLQIVEVAGGSVEPYYYLNIEAIARQQGDMSISQASFFPQGFEYGNALLNTGSTFVGIGEQGLRYIRQYPNGPRDIARGISNVIGRRVGTQATARFLSNTFNGAKSLGSKLGGLGLALSTTDYIANFDNKTGYDHANYWIGMGVMAVSYAVPIVGIIYGGAQLGSYLYNGKSLEENVGKALGY